MLQDLGPFSLTRELISTDMTGLPASRQASTCVFFGFILSRGGLIASLHDWQKKHVTTLPSPKRKMWKNTPQPWWILLGQQLLMARF